MTIRIPDDPAKAQAWLSGVGTPEMELDLYVPRGNKGDPGGITLGTILGTANLDEIKASGVYRQTGTAAATVLNNYPVTAPGVLLVLESNAGAQLEQEYRPHYYSPVATYAQVTYRRQFYNAAWSPWRTFAAQRVDNTAGRAIYAWDPTANREQLIYGDTGWRNISASFPTLTAGAVYMRRNGAACSLVMNDCRFSDPNGTAAFTPVVPVGFRPTLWENFQSISSASIASAGNAVRVRSDSGISIYDYVTNAQIRLSGTWQTVDPWPTTLPGTAVGSVPNL